MATVIDPAGATGAGPERTLASFVDRWIFVFMAGFLVVTVLVGFIPTSIQKVTELQAGMRPPLPAVLHVHAVLMGSWLMLLLAQTVLMATGRSAYHKQLGMAGMVIAPAIVLAGFFLVPTMTAYNFAILDTMPPEVMPPEAVLAFKHFILSVMAGQILVGVLFPLFVGLALLARKTDPGMHKRLLILATAVPMGAAVDRMSWLPATIPDSPLSTVGYTLVLILPMLAWDLVRHRRLHRAYIVWLALFLSASALMMYAWMKPWWIAFAQDLQGVTI